jgi:hypothetical protein
MNNNINTSTNNIYLDLNKNEIKIKLIFDILKELIDTNKTTNSLIYKLNEENNNNDEDKKIIKTKIINNATKNKLIRSR